MERWSKAELGTLTALVGKHGQEWNALTDEMGKAGYSRTADALRRKWSKVIGPRNASNGSASRTAWTAEADAVLLSSVPDDVVQHPYSSSFKTQKCLSIARDRLSASGHGERTDSALRGRLAMFRDITPACVAQQATPEQLALAAAPQPAAQNYVDASPRALAMVVSTLRAARLARVALAIKCVTGRREYDGIANAA